MSPVEATSVELISPFPKESLETAWEWLNQFPDANFDDYGPKTFQEFKREMRARALHEQTWGVLNNGYLCGIIAFLPISEHVGTFHGIVLAQAVHGTGVARRAVRIVIDELFANGFQKLQATYFASNARIERLLLSLGAQYEGTLLRQTVQHGQPIDMRLAAFHKES